MCATYQSFGAAGLVSSGAGRDFDPFRDLAFATFTNGTICSHAYCQMPAIMAEVEVSGLTIQPGDLLHSDGNGVITIPLEIAADVANACAEFVRAEAVQLDHLQSGDVTRTGLVEATAERKQLIEGLRKRVAATAVPDHRVRR
jgi:regulator of RNase E activity RraA